MDTHRDPCLLQVEYLLEIPAAAVPLHYDQLAGHAAERKAEAAAGGDACSGISLLCAIWRRDGLINKSRIDPAQIVAVTSGLPLTEALIAAAIFTSREIFSLSFSAAIRA